jgi:subtilisin family serine protease
MARHARLRPPRDLRPVVVAALGGVVAAAVLVASAADVPALIADHLPGDPAPGAGDLAFRVGAQALDGEVTVLHDDGTVTRLAAGSPAARRAVTQGARAAGSGVRAVGLTQPVAALGAAPGLRTATTPKPTTTSKPGSPAAGPPTAAEMSRQYFLQQIGAARSWAAGAAGAGITVAVLDSGVDRSHQDLAGQVVAQADCTGRRGCTTKVPQSTPYWHGTHVAGVVAAAANGKSVVGVAPRAKLLDVRVLDASGNGDTAMVTAGVEWAVAHGAKILNLSIGSPGDDPALHAAIRRATARGVLVVTAAGNDFDPCVRASAPSYPAAYLETLAVAATNTDGTHAWFSSVSSYVDLAAPGVSVVSDSPGNQVSPADGTSVAAPQVSGAAADLWSAHPKWTAAQVRAELLRTAVDLGIRGRDDVFGAGLVQATPIPGGAAPGAAAGNAPGITRGAASGGGAAVSLTVARSAPYATPVAVSVRVTAPGGIPGCGAAVTVQVRAAGNRAAPWLTATKLSAGADGSAVTRVTVSRTTAVRAVVSGAGWLPQASSDEVQIRAVPVIRVAARRSGASLVLNVRTAPAARLALALQRLDPARKVWVTVARTSTDQLGAARFPLQAGHRTATLRVLSAGSADWPAATSATLTARLAG